MPAKALPIKKKNKKEKISVSFSKELTTKKKKPRNKTKVKKLSVTERGEPNKEVLGRSEKTADKSKEIKTKIKAK